MIAFVAGVGHDTAHDKSLIFCRRLHRSSTVTLFAAEPPQSLKDRLPRLAPKEPADAFKTFKVLDGFRMDLVAAEPLVAQPGRRGVRRGRPALRRRDARLPERRTSPARRRSAACGSSKTATATASTRPRPSSPTGCTGRPASPAGTAASSSPPRRTSGTSKTPTATARPTSAGKSSPASSSTTCRPLVNGLQWGLDNKIYGVTAGNGGEIRPADQPNAAAGLGPRPRLPLRPADRRIRGDLRRRPSSATRSTTGTTASSATSGSSPGTSCCRRTRLARNPFLPGRPQPYTTVRPKAWTMPLPMFRISPPEPWRVVRTERYHAEGQKHAAERDGRHGRLHVRHRRHDLPRRGLPAELPRPGVRRRCRGQPRPSQGAGRRRGRRSRPARIDEKCEFVASTDNWFRPVNFVNAPDGTLHVLDMYREIVEHPWSIPDDIKAHLDLESGRDRGRIYRLTPPGFAARPAATRARRPRPNWSRRWRTRTPGGARRPNDCSINVRTPPPSNRCGGWRERARLPLARLHALGTLHGLGELEPVDINAALRDPAPGVREQAVQFAEPRLKKSPELAAAVRGLSDDADRPCRYQVAIALGALPDEAATAALARIARRDVADPSARLAVLSSSAERSVALFAALLHDAGPQETAFLGQLAAIIGSRRADADTSHVLELVTAPGRPRAMQRDLLLGMGDGLLRTGRTLDALKMPAAARNLLDELVRDAERIAADQKAAIADRTAAIQLLAHAPFDRARADVAANCSTSASRRRCNRPAYGRCGTPAPPAFRRSSSTPGPASRLRSAAKRSPPWRVERMGARAARCRGSEVCPGRPYRLDAPCRPPQAPRHHCANPGRRPARRFRQDAAK